MDLKQLPKWATIIRPFVDSYDYKPSNEMAADETYVYLHPHHARGFRQIQGIPWQSPEIYRRRIQCLSTCRTTIQDGKVPMRNPAAESH